MQEVYHCAKFESFCVLSHQHLPLQLQLLGPHQEA